MGLAFDVYSAANPNGSLLATLTDALNKKFAIQLDGAGSGEFTLPRSSSQATTTIVAQGNIVKVRLTEVSATPIFAFWMETGRFDLVGAEDAPELLTFGGKGALSYLARAIMWSQSFIAGEVGPTTGNEWPLHLGVNGSKAGAILRRVIAEAIDVDRPQQPLPSLSFDFTYTTDSNGNTWATTPGTNSFIVHTGDHLDVVIGQLLGATTSMVIQMDANLGLHAYNTFGVNRESPTFASGKVRLAKGVNVATALTRELAASRIVSHMLTTGDPGYYGTASSATTPVREGFATSSGTDETALDALAASQLALRSANSDSIKLGIPYGNTPLTTGYYWPGPVGSNGHYWVGDTITVHTGTGQHDYNNSGQRIVEIAVHESEGGDPIAEVSLGSRYSGGLFANLNDVILQARTDMANAQSEAMRYAHSLHAPIVVASLPTLPDASFPLGSIVFLTTDEKLYRVVDGNLWSNDVDGADIVTGTIVAGALAVGAVTATAILAGAIETDKLDALAVTADKLAANAVTATKIDAGAVTAAKIAAGAITADKLSVGSFGANVVANGSFEDLGPTGGSIAGWTGIVTGDGAASREDTTNAKDGGTIATCYAGAGSPNSARFESAKVPVVAGEVLFGTLWYRSTSTITDGIYFRFVFYDSADAYLTTIDLLSDVGGGSTWTQAKGYVTVPANARRLSVVVYNYQPSAATYVNFDQCVVQRASGAVLNSDGNVAVNASGITVTNGKITVTNPGSVVIIDGSSNMFKIAATGGHGGSWPTGTGQTLTATETLTALTYTAGRCPFTVMMIDNGLDEERAPGVFERISTAGVVQYWCRETVEMNGSYHPVMRCIRSNNTVDPGAGTVVGYYAVLKEEAF